VIIAPRKNRKTQTIAALSVYRLLTSAGTVVPGLRVSTAIVLSSTTSGSCSDSTAATGATLLRWQNVEMLERGLHVRRSFVRGEMGEPKSRAGRRTIGYGPRAADVLEEQWKASLYRATESLVFCHPALGSPLDPSKVSGYMCTTIKAASIERTIRPCHDLRHTALTHDAAAGNPAVYVQLAPDMRRRR